MKESSERLLEIKKELQEQGLTGFQILKYNAIPRFHATCIDIDTKNGKISITNYLPKKRRSENPVIQFSQYSNPKLFKMYKSVIKKLLITTSEIK